MAELKIQDAYETASRHHRAGRFAQAEGIYREILARNPEDVYALHSLGALALQAREFGAGIDLLGRTVRLTPNDPTAHCNLGTALKGARRLDEAIASYGEAVRLKPDYAQAHNNLGSALNDVGKFEEAVVCFRHAIGIKSDYAEAHYNLGIALKGLGRLDETIASHRTAIQIKPDFAEAHNNLCNALWAIGDIEAAINASRKAVEAQPDFAVANSVFVFSINYHPAYDSGMIHEELRRWNQRHAEPLRKLIQPHTNSRDPDRRLRIGYVSPDFREHAVGRNMIPLFREHDRGQVEIFAYSNSITTDWLTERLRGYADGWRSIADLADSKAADLIREDKIDILVDLALHTSKGRLLIFARKPAPVQVTFAGYPGSTGLEAIDYRLTDPYLDPPDMYDRFYSEESIRLRDSFWCYDPLDSEAVVNTLPALKQGYVTFGSLNNIVKVNEKVLVVWAEVLKTIDRSRLMLLCREGRHRQLLLDTLREHGIEGDRVEFFAQAPRVKYLEQYNRIDVGLDPFPYNGHTTSLDSLWMGVPVVTLAGRTVVARAGVSQSNNLGMTELIAQTREEYVRIAARLAGDLPRLAELRGGLRARMEASPLMDARRFARNIEEAYRQMWRTWCARGNEAVHV